MIMVLDWISAIGMVICGIGLVGCAITRTPMISVTHHHYDSEGNRSE